LYDSPTPRQTNFHVMIHPRVDLSGLFSPWGWYTVSIPLTPWQCT